MIIGSQPIPELEEDESLSEDEATETEKTKAEWKYTIHKWDIEVVHTFLNGEYIKDKEDDISLKMLLIQNGSKNATVSLTYDQNQTLPPFLSYTFEKKDPMSTVSLVIDKNLIKKEDDGFHQLIVDLKDFLDIDNPVDQKSYELTHKVQVYINYKAIYEIDS